MVHFYSALLLLLLLPAPLPPPRPPSLCCIIQTLHTFEKQEYSTRLSRSRRCLKSALVWTTVRYSPRVRVDVNLQLKFLRSCKSRCARTRTRTNSNFTQCYRGIHPTELIRAITPASFSPTLFFTSSYGNGVARPIDRNGRTPSLVRMRHARTREKPRGNITRGPFLY